jgi:hypothetical protein
MINVLQRDKSRHYYCRIVNEIARPTGSIGGAAATI